MLPNSLMSSRNLTASKKMTLPSVSIIWTTVLVLAVSPSVWAARKKHPSPPAPPDPGYVFALAAANRFLHAWQTGDLETGTILLSNRVRHSHDPEKFEQSFSGDPGRAFEIARGQGNRERYKFQVVLVTTSGSRLQRRFSEIVVINTGKDDWVVDKLP